MIGNNNVNVLCVDDNHLVGEALEIRLKQEGGFRWLGQLHDADSLLNLIDELRPDVILLDIDMPGRDPFLVLQEISKHHPNVRVIMLTGHVRRELVDQAFEAGAWGYLSKIEGAGRIGAAIRQVMEGEVVLGQDVESTLGPW